MNNKVINQIPQEDINEIMVSYYNNFNDLKQIGFGFSAQVFKYKNYAIKAYEDEGFNDGKILENFQDNDLFLKLYFYNEYFMVTEYLEIIPAYKYFERNIDINYTAKDIFQYCREKGFIINDVHDDNVIITSNDKLKIIDVGCFRELYKPYTLDEIVCSNYSDYTELENIINHVKRPPIAI
jgi:serine/threonine protein kinase